MRECDDVQCAEPHTSEQERGRIGYANPLRRDRDHRRHAIEQNDAGGKAHVLLVSDCLFGCEFGITAARVISGSTPHGRTLSTARWSRTVAP